MGNINSNPNRHFGNGRIFNGNNRVIYFDINMKNNTFKNKNIFITGGTGSFGSFFVKNILNYKPRKIIIFSRDEDKQYWLQNDLKDYKDYLQFVIGDVRDKRSIEIAFQDGVDILIHAAALKQIPSSEYNIFETIKTNIMGAQNIVDTAIKFKVKKVLSISTDKAVEPINVMGMTKALQERIFTLGNKQKGNMKIAFSSVRYGNVVASRGSVIPFFKKQIDKGGPITITDKRMTRFILTLKDATNLVLDAVDDMIGGEIFIPIVKPLRIIDLAEVMIKELKPKYKNIIEIGIRPGEKLHETLISPIESIRSIKKRNYFLVLPQIELKEIGYNYRIPHYKKMQFRYSSDNGPFMTKKEIKSKLKEENII